MQSDDERLHSFADVVASYRGRYAEPHRRELNWFRNPGQTLLEAIHRACISRVPKKRGEGLKRHSHQPLRSVPEDALLEAAARLEGHEGGISSAPNFATLHNLIDACTRSIRGIGELAVYDIALRIAAYRGLRPTEVYLHAGTREGARALGLDTSRKSIPMVALPIEFQSLTGDEAEDVLCIYRLAIDRIRRGIDQTSSPRSICVSPEKPNAPRTRTSGCY